MSKVRSGHVGFWPRTDQVLTYSIRDSDPHEVTLRLASGWSVHLPATASGAAYLRGLAAVVAKCAEDLEKAAPYLGPR
ncbi:hypothetical protein [Flindersiella endophytica]